MGELPILHQQQIVAADTWSLVLKRGQRLQLTDTSGKGSCVMLAFHARNTSERYNMPDTLKGQHTSKLTTGHCLYSDMGRVLLSVVSDDRGWHDPLGAISNAHLVEEKFGNKSYQEYRNAWTRNTHDNLIIEMGKYGLTHRDWHAPVNWFSTVVTQDGPDNSGELVFDTSKRKAGDSVVVRAELDVLLILSATPHPFDPIETYDPEPIDVAILDGEPAPAGDPCRTSCSENGRAYELTDIAALAY